ncbi:hypothetical protein VitviT2T_029277 [Vitis vinifera]|uniref:Uncharacterized protein n=1 Tax=Vitis vinifera TaxID=29760 RepID=A0ABY9DVV9_VITVI|nr:hypothetical protein VitviT2T_029277 [Vitis vinifera]
MMEKAEVREASPEVLGVGPSCQLSIPPPRLRHPLRRVPTSASGSGANSCGLVSAPGSGASSRSLVSASEDASSVEPGRLGESLPRASPTMLLPPSSYSGRAG